MGAHPQRQRHSHDYKEKRKKHHDKNDSEQHFLFHATERLGLLDPVGNDRIPMMESMLLDPIEKLKRYKIFPWKLVVHTTIVILLLVYTYGFHTTIAERLRNERFGLARTFSDSDFESNTGRSMQLHFYSIPDMVSFLQLMATRYYTIPEDSPGVFMHYVLTPDTNAPVPPLMTVQMIKDPRQMRSMPLAPGTITETLTYNLTEANDYLGVFNESTPGISFDCVPTSPDYIPCRNNTLAGIVDRIVGGDITMQLRSIRFLVHDSDASVAHWDLRIHFYPDDHGALFLVNFDLTSVVTEAPTVLPVVITTLLVPMVLWHLWLRIRAFQRYHIYMKLVIPAWMTRESSRKYRERHAGTSWKVFAIVIDVICLAFICLSFVDLFISRGSMRIDLWRSLLLAFSLSGYNLLYVSYLQTSPKFYVLVKTIALAIPKLLVYCIGVLPIFAAFTLTGVAVVGPFAQDTFGTIQLAACTLFCVLNGDSLLQLFTEINQTPFPPLRMFTRIYFMSFLAYTIICALNVMLGIVQDSYTEVSDYFQICQFDIEKANEELDLKDLPAADRRKKKLESEQQRRERGPNRFSQYETGSTTQDDTSSSHCSSSDCSTSSDTEELDEERLRNIARKVYKLGSRQRRADAVAPAPAPGAAALGR